MKVRTKLGLAIALPVVLLGAMLVSHIRTTRHAVATVHELTEIWSQVHRISIEQLQRVAQLEESAAKYLVTRDRGYLLKLRDLAGSFEEELQALQALPLTGRAREEIVAVGAAWEAFAPLTDRLAEPTRSSAALDRQLTAAVEALRHQTALVSQASHEAMVVRLAESQHAARQAERAALAAGAGALVLSALIALLIVRAIAGPISRLAEGTLEIGQGRFDYRLDDARDDEFARVATEFNRMAERLGEVDRMKRDFVSTVSHDLKTPLASMQETTGLLLDEVAGPLTGTQRHLLHLHRESGRRLGRMLAQLLDLSRLDACPAPVVRLVPVADLIQGAVQQADPAGAFPGRRVAVRLTDQPVLLACDPDRGRQLLDNLLDNALKFSPPDREVRVEAQLLTTPPRWIAGYRWAQVRRDQALGGVLLLTVTDQGPGIPDAEKNLVFSRFHQSGRRTGIRERGVGLGLAICREIVLGHGGTIWVADTPGGGSQFRILLPGAHPMPEHSPVTRAMPRAVAAT